MGVDEGFASTLPLLQVSSWSAWAQKILGKRPCLLRQRKAKPLKAQAASDPRETSFQIPHWVIGRILSTEARPLNQKPLGSEVPARKVEENNKK